MNITVIVPTGNRAILLRQAVALQNAQTFEDARELVIVDGGDRPFDVATLPELDHVWVNYVRCPAALSIGLRRNLAIERSIWSGSTAEEHVVLHQDDDDWYHPDYLTTLLRHFAEGGQHLGGMSQFFHYDFLLKRGWKTNLWRSTQPYGSTFIYSRATWERAGRFDDLNRGEDDAFFRAILAKGLTAKALQQRPDLHVYMRHSKNVSWNIDPIIDKDQTAEARAILGRAIDFYDDLAELAVQPTPLELGPQWHVPSNLRKLGGPRPKGSR